MRGSSSAARWLLSRCLTSPTILLRDLESPRFDEPCRWKELDCATLGDPPPKKFFRLNLIFWKAENLELRSSIYLVPFHTVRSKKGPKNDQIIRDPHIICESHNQPKNNSKFKTLAFRKKKTLSKDQKCTS